ncbi:MAG: hypothetical protein AAGH68_07565 [Pseudomonadota bacterium]
MNPDTLRINSLVGAPDDLLGASESDWQTDGFLLDRVDKDALSQVLDALRPESAPSQPTVAEFRMSHNDGHVVWVQLCRLHHMTSDGEMLVSLLTIDEQVLVERALARAVETMRDALVTTSHEISQPANAISDYGGLLERHLSTQRDHVGSDYALGIREAVERLKDLSDSLQKVGRRAGTQAQTGN